jgi:hypothetical protein
MEKMKVLKGGVWGKRERFRRQNAEYRMQNLWEKGGNGAGL